MAAAEKNGKGWALTQKRLVIWTSVHFWQKKTTLCCFRRSDSLRTSSFVWFLFHWVLSHNRFEVRNHNWHFHLGFPCSGLSYSLFFTSYIWTRISSGRPESWPEFESQGYPVFRSLDQSSNARISFIHNFVQERGLEREMETPKCTDKEIGYQFDRMVRRKDGTHWQGESQRF